MTDFISQYRAAFEAVDRPLTAEDAISEEKLEAAQQRLGHKLPKALLDFYRVAGNAEFHCNEGALIKLRDLQDENGKLVFMSADGGIVDGINLSSDSEDPMVYTTNDPELNWEEYKQGICSQYLLCSVFYVAASKVFPIRADDLIAENIRILVDKNWKLFAATAYQRSYASSDGVIALWKYDSEWGMRIGVKNLDTLNEISNQLGITLEQF